MAHGTDIERLVCLVLLTLLTIAGHVLILVVGCKLAEVFGLSWWLGWLAAEIAAVAAVVGYMQIELIGEKKGLSGSA